MDPEDNANPAGDQTPAPAPSADQETPPEGYLSKEQVDALVKARIDKQSAKHAKETDELRSQLEAAQAERDSAKAEAEAAKAREERAMAVEKAAAATGVPAKVLAAMAGDTAEEIDANAKLLAEAIPKAPGFPEVPDGGAGGQGAVTVEDIEAIKDPVERLRARRDNIALFSK